MWRHVTRPVQFSLVVDDFGVKYEGKENAEHLINAIKSEGYKLSIDWEGTKYCGITLKWNYDLRTLTISMPGYVQKMLLRFKHGGKEPVFAVPTTTKKIWKKIR